MVRFFIICLSFFASFTAEASSIDHTFKLYNELLGAYVSPGEKEGITVNLVDYDAWAKDSRHKSAMIQIKKADPLALKSVEETIAFWINTYNLLTIDLVIQKKESQSIRNLGGLFGNPWDNFKWQIGPKSYTLNDIEHSILRTLDEPRIHFALNCASLSCPDLAPEAYSAEKIYTTLDIKTKNFMDNPTKGMVVTEKSGTSHVELSQIFKWYRDDFSSIEKFITKYTNVKNIYIDSYIKYNWNLNKRK
jgi:hypothetical protein